MTHQQAIDSMASERYLLDEMSEVERFEFEAHYFDCAECAEDVRLADMIREEARGGGARDAETTNVVRATFPGHRSSKSQGLGHRSSKSEGGWRRSMQTVPWAAAAALALMVGYQSLVTVPALKDSVASEPLAPVMLRGATRGTVPVVAIGSKQHFVTLAVDVMPTQTTNALRYELVHDGHAVLSGDAPLPQAGAPLMLIVPAAELEHHARYSLIVRSAGSTNAVIGEYDFDVS
jgi:anti-sigma factor RsiW